MEKKNNNLTSQEPNLNWEDEGGNVPSDDGERETDISGSASPLNTSEIIHDSLGSGDGFLVVRNNSVDLFAIEESVLR